MGLRWPGRPGRRRPPSGLRPDDRSIAIPGRCSPCPSRQYVRPDLLDGRLVHQPLPYVLGGDVLYASGRGAEGGPDRAGRRPARRSPGPPSRSCAPGSRPPASWTGWGSAGSPWSPTVDPTYDDLRPDPGSDLEVVVDGPDPHPLPGPAHGARRWRSPRPGRGRPRPDRRAPGPGRRGPGVHLVPSRVRGGGCGGRGAAPRRRREPRPCPRDPARSGTGLQSWSCWPTG